LTKSGDFTPFCLEMIGLDRATITISLHSSRHSRNRPHLRRTNSTAASFARTLVCKDKTLSRTGRLVDGNQLVCLLLAMVAPPMGKQKSLLCHASCSLRFLSSRASELSLPRAYISARDLPLSPSFDGELMASYRLAL
jgi:hypothetical protein